MNPRLPSLLTGAVALLLVACSVARTPPPWPPYGSAVDDPAAASQGSPQPMAWGVPAFEAPSANDCHAPMRMTEQPGSVGRQGHAGAPGGVMARDERARSSRMDLAAEAAAPMLLAPSASPPPSPSSSVSKSLQRLGPVSAGMVDDNADFGEYLAYRQRRPAGLTLRDRDIGERYRIEVRDSRGAPVGDAEVALTWPGAPASVAWARTDAGGSVWLHPRAILPPDVEARETALEVQVRRGTQLGRSPLLRGQKHGVEVRLGAPMQAAPRARLDLVFMVDATGSMGDEIQKLKTSLRDIASQIQALPSQPDLCFGMVAYRDRGDAFVTRRYDFTDRLGDFQAALDQLQAGGGGDTPEDLNAALHEAVHELSWRGDGATRLVVLVADAPPHLDYGGPQYDADIAAALAKGIKLFAVGASGLDPSGEAVFRQMAQYTGGRFVFLTYKDAADPGSGPGRETVHDVRNYSVQSLDALIVRLVREELARRAL